MFALVISAGCGGKDKAAPVTPTGAGHESAEHEGDHHGLSSEMTQFHELLRPHWHDEGPTRMKDTCGAIEQYKTYADAVAKATPPETANADTWTAGTRALVAAVGDLATACAGTNTTAFQTAFSKVHDAFHALMEAGATSGKGGGGTDGGGKDASGSAAAPEHHDEHHEHGGH
jgi:hypothetical protein